MSDTPNKPLMVMALWLAAAIVIAGVLIAVFNPFK